MFYPFLSWAQKLPGLEMTWASLPLTNSTPSQALSHVIGWTTKGAGEHLPHEQVAEELGPESCASHGISQEEAQGM